MEGNDYYLLSMLKGKRFNYYPRALHEPWVEISDDNGVVVEKNIVLKYHAPIYFFTNKANHRLQQRLAIGLERLISSGEFDQYFYQHELIRDVLQKAQLDKRKVFELENYNNSKKTRALAKDKSLWFDLTKSRLNVSKNNNDE